MAGLWGVGRSNGRFLKKEGRLVGIHEEKTWDGRMYCSVLVAYWVSSCPPPPPPRVPPPPPPAPS
eukprot:2920699-Pyramimonas_sp.AAC.1